MKSDSALNHHPNSSRHKNMETHESLHLNYSRSNPPTLCRKSPSTLERLCIQTTAVLPLNKPSTWTQSNASLTEPTRQKAIKDAAQLSKGFYTNRGIMENSTNAPGTFLFFFVALPPTRHVHTPLCRAHSSPTLCKSSSCADRRTLDAVAVPRQHTSIRCGYLPYYPNCSRFAEFFIFGVIFFRFL